MAAPKRNTRNASASDTDDTITLQSLDAKLNTILNISNASASDIKTLKEEQKEMCKSIDMCHSQIESIHDTIKQQNKYIKDLETSVTALKNENAELNSKVSNLESKLGELTQYSHRNCLIISGIPETSNENLDYLLGRVATVIGFPEYSFKMVDAAHRLGNQKAISSDPAKPEGQSSGPRPMIIKFVRRLDKELFLHKRKLKRSLKASELGFASDNSIYVNESLTPDNRKLMKATRDLAKSKGYDYVWTANTKIYVRKSTGLPAIVISTLDDLSKL